MGQSRKRIGKNGKARYTAYFDDIRGNRVSLGTFSNIKDANSAWQGAEAKLGAGRVGDPRRGRQTLERYIEDEWFPHHVIEEKTRESYGYLLNRYIIPGVGTIPMVELLPGHVREWILKLQTKYDANPPTIKKCKVILDAVLTTALNDQVTFLHAGKGVKTPPVATKPLRIITSAQFDKVYEALGEATMQLLVETDIESGLRWGELTELRVKDLDVETGILTIARAVVHLTGTPNSPGPRFAVKDYPKDKEWRQLGLPSQLVNKLKAHVMNNGLLNEDLLFQMPLEDGPQRRTRPEELPDPETLGWTEPNEKGHRHRHGTTTAYSTGKCRCQHCKNAMAAYRAARRASGVDQPRRHRTVSTDGHIGGGWFRVNIWSKALAKAELGFHVTPHGMRHAHASWLLAGGADLQVVKERLGHGSIATTQRYLHALPGADAAALKAMDAYRNASSQNDIVEATAKKPKDKKRKGHRDELAEMKKLMAQMSSTLESLKTGTSPDS